MAPLVLALLPGCTPWTDLYFVTVDGGSVRVPVAIAEFDGYRLKGSEVVDVASQAEGPQWLPAGASVPTGEFASVGARFGGDALRLRGRTAGGTPFSMHVPLDSLTLPDATVPQESAVLVLDLGALVDGNAIDEEEAALDPDPDDGVPVAMVYPADSDRSVVVAGVASSALWLGAVEDAPARFSGHWPFTAEQFGVDPEEESSGCGAAAVVAQAPAAPDTGIPDTSSVPSDTSWSNSGDSADSSASGGCGGEGDSVSAADSSGETSGTDTSELADSGADSSGCACGGGGDSGAPSVDSSDSARIRRPAGTGWFATLIGLPSLVAWRRRRSGQG